MTDERLLYTVSDLLRILPWSRSELYRRMGSGDLEYIQAGSRRLFEPSAVQSLIASLKAGTSGADRIIELLDDEHRIDVAMIPSDATLADIREAQRIIAERRQAA